MKQKTLRSSLFMALSIVCLAQSVTAATTYSFATLTSSTAPTATVPGVVTGSISTPGGLVGITYTGDVSAYTEVNNTGANFYTGWQSVYENSTVANIPTRTDTIALDERYQTTGLITFSAPIVNPILDIVSLGSPGDTVAYTFTTAPSILSQGAAYWGGCSTCLSVSGDTLSGAEGSGVVLLTGTFSSISFTETGVDYLWDGFNVGVAGLAPSAPTAAPEPSTVWLAGSALGVLFGVSRLRKVRRLRV